MLNRFLLLPVFSLLSLSFSTENSNPPAFADLLKKLNEEYPQEKVYLQTDKPYYLAGDKIWFQSYVTAGALHQLSPLSKTVYVELINSDEQPVSKHLVRVDNGLGHGQVELPRFLATGSYQLRAYTNWMRNFSKELFFTKELKIWNVDEPETPAKSVGNNIDLQFFPEGGSLIANLRVNVAFKAIGEDGLHRNVTGKVITANGETIADFKSSHDGMGIFSFTPKANETYTARINESTASYALPRVQESGFLITLVPKWDAPDVTLKIQSTSQTPNREAITLVTHNRGIPAFIAQANLTSNLYFVKIPKSKLLHGLAHFTLFDAAGRPQANRLFFSDFGSPLQIEVKTTEPFSETRKPTIVEILTRDANNQPIPAFVSLAATNAEEVITDDFAGTIESYLLLQSDLKGHIENPGYYFNTANKDRLEKLDLLLMTQGWVRFDWNKLVGGEWPPISHGIEQGISLEGTMKDDLTKKGLEGGQVTFVPIEGSSDIVVAPTGKEGRFIFDNLTFYDSSAVVMQGKNRKDKPFVLLEIDPIYPTEAAQFKAQQMFNSRSEFEQFIVRKGLERNKINASFGFGEDVVVLDEVEVKGTKIDETRENRVYQNASKSVRASEVPGAVNLFHPLELLRGVAGVQLRPNPPGYDVTIRGIGSIGGGIAPLVLLDNVPVNIATLNQIAVESIESVDLFTGAEAAVFGSQGGNGVIAFFSKKGFTRASEKKGVLNARLGGYQVAKEFYVPKYDVAKPEHVKPDRRTTVFWKSAIATDEKGFARLEFYNSDEPTTVRIQVEGISKEGLMGVGINRYDVRKSN